MQYLIYFAVTTPLLLGWLFYEAAMLPAPEPLFGSSYEHVSTQPAQKLAGAPVANAPSKKLARNESSTTD